MKSFIAALLTFALIYHAALANEGGKNKIKDNSPVASTPLAVGMYHIKQENALKILVTNNNDEQVTVRIKDAGGQVVYTDVVKNYGKFGRKYVLSSLNKGEYTIEISNRSSAVTQTLVL